MESLIAQLERAGLVRIRAHKGGEAAVIEADHESDGLLVGKYVVVPAEPEWLSGLAENAGAFERFEDERIAPFFFRLRGDWSWSLYVVYVLRDDAYARLPVDRKRRIEGGKRYGRKLVVPFSAVTETVPVAKLPSEQRRFRGSDPYSDWSARLREAGLSFCLEPYSSKLLSDYIEGALVAAPSDPNGGETEGGSDLAAVLEVRRPNVGLGAIRFGSRYRPHCWTPDTAIDFARINLLEGANGAGKTSVLEAIELAFTGKILRDEMAGRDGAEPWDGGLTLAVGDREELLDALPGPSERRERQSRFYRHRDRERVRNTQLNQLFHQHNYFSSEAVYRFCYDRQPDYRQSFARVVFGEEMALIEERWGKYKEEFGDKWKSLRDRFVETEAELDMLRAQIREREERIAAGLETALPLLEKLIRRTAASFPLVGRKADGRDIRAWLERLYALVSEADVVAKPLAEAGALGLSTFGDASGADAALLREIAELQAARDEAARRRAELPDPAALQRELHERERAMIGLDARIAEFGRWADELKRLGPLLDDGGKRRRRTELEREASALRRRVELLEPLERVCRDANAAAGFGYERREEAERKREELERRRADVRLSRSRLAERIRTEEEKADSAHRLLAHIQSLGLQYAKEHEAQGKCPMCGVDHRTAAKLRALIEHGIRHDESELHRLRVEERELTRENERLDAELAHLADELKRLAELEEAAARLNLHAGELGLKPIAASASVSDTRSGLLEAAARLDEARGALEDVLREARRLDEAGFTLARIGQLDQLLALVSAEKLDASLLTADRLQAALTIAADNQLKERGAAEERIRLLRLEWKAAEEARLRADAALAAADRGLTDRNGRLRRLAGVRQAAESLRERGFRPKDDDGIEPWRASLAKLLEEARLLLETMRTSDPLAVDIAERDRLEAERAALALRRDRCGRALEALNGLRPLSAYIDGFVEANIAAIGDLFVRLHAPREFERLALRGDELVAFRRGRTDADGCGVNEMSTGQRTAVLLSIFFVMHLSMETAPNFILLDEPVANMDDLNVLGLLDFLRQLTIERGTQIVFTTANPAVASLFRRKFSIFEERFRSFRLSRPGDEGVRIVAETYVPDKEEAVPVAT
ncbi:AAA family ATPase [Paenibacillus flagellatus]|uniref:AAA family ATPase n=1 Tax=Paenibacillus flagellatus TaxID=2211139 RepID=UPI00130514D0|nr:AAA family ATPase [Paenibacillus flagellatus]